MIVVNIIFYFLVLVLLVGILYFTMKKQPVIKYDISEVDVDLLDLHKFIRRETLYQIVAWFTSKASVKNMSSSDHASVILAELKDHDVINKKVKITTSIIVGNLSPAIIEQFKSVYNVKAYSSTVDALSYYVSREVLFYFRKINIEITALAERNKQESVDNILKLYTLSIENEIYKNNSIEIASELGEDKNREVNE